MSRVLSALVVLALGCAPKAPVTESPVSTSTASSAPKQSADEQVAAAVARMEAGDAASAETMLAGVVRAEPKHVGARFNQGVARYALGDLPGAIDSFAEAVRLDPDDAVAWLYLGVAREKSGQLSQALDEYRTGIDRDPENMDLRVALIGALRKLGRVDDAHREAKAALKINARSLAVYNNIGLAYIDAGEYDLAQFVYQKALSSITNAAPEDLAYIECNLGWTFYKGGDGPTAELHLDKALELDPELVPALIYRARIHQDNRQYTEMAPLLERALAMDPDNVGVQINLGIAQRGIGNIDGAEKTWRTLAEANPPNLDAMFNLGILLGDDRKDYEAGAAMLQAYVDQGGAEAARAQEYMEEFEKERSRAERKRAKEEEAKRRKAEMEERKRLLEEAGDAATPTPDGADAAPPAEPPQESPPADAPPAEPPAGDDAGDPPANDDSPWN